MQIAQSTLFYWIHRKWPHSMEVRAFGGGLVPDASNSASVAGSAAGSPGPNGTPALAGTMLARTMFWGSPNEMSGNLVVVDADELAQISKRYPGTVFLCVGCGDPQLCHPGNDYILVPDEERVGKVFNYLGTVFDKIDRWGDMLEQASRDFLSYDALVKSCEMIVDEPMALISSDLHYVSYSKRLAMEQGFEARYVQGGTNLLSFEAMNLFAALPDYNLLEKRTGVFSYAVYDNLLIRNIFHNGDYIGRLALPCPEDEAKRAFYRDVLEIVGFDVERLYARLGTFFRQPAAHARFRQMLASIMEGERLSEELVASQAEQVGYERGDMFSLVQIRPQALDAGDETVAALLAHLEALLPMSVCFKGNGRCFLLVDKTRNNALSNRGHVSDLNSFLRDGFMIAGVSRDFRSMLDLTVAARQTDIALEYGRRIDPMFWCLEFDSYAFEYLVEHGCSGFRAEDVVSPAVLKLQEHDRAEGTSLCDTLRTFIDAKYNAVDAAKRLFVARSTFLKRMARVRSITGVNLDDAEERLYLALSFRILEKTEG